MLTPSVQGQAQSYRTFPNGYSEGAGQILESRVRTGSDEMYVTQTGSGSSIQGSGSTLPWAVGGLLLGAAALVGVRRAVSWSQDQTDPSTSDPMGTPQSSLQQLIRGIYSGLASDINQEVARERHQLAVERYKEAVEAAQAAIELDTQWSQEAAQTAQLARDHV
jgi:hypothetical protein